MNWKKTTRTQQKEYVRNGVSNVSPTGQLGLERSHRLLVGGVSGLRNRTAVGRGLEGWDRLEGISNPPLGRCEGLTLVGHGTPGNRVKTPDILPRWSLLAMAGG